MQRVVITAGKERTHEKLHVLARTEHLPGEAGHRITVDGEELQFNSRPVWQLVNPMRPRLRAEGFDTLRPVTADHLGSVALRREHERAGGGFNPGIESVHQHQSPGGRRGGSEQQRVVTTRADAG